MSGRMIFLSLPVQNLHRARTFYEGLGFRTISRHLEFRNEPGKGTERADVLPNATPDPERT